MPDSTFDPDTFLTQTHTEPFATSFEPIPAGNYTSTVGTVTARQSGEYTILDVQHIIHDEVLATNMGRERLMVRQSIFLDLDSNGHIASGPDKNTRLGRLRAAVGQNETLGWTPKMLEGAGPLSIVVSVRPRKGDEGQMDNDVRATSPLREAA